MTHPTFDFGRPVLLFAKWASLLDRRGDPTLVPGKRRLPLQCSLDGPHSSAYRQKDA